MRLIGNNTRKLSKLPLFERRWKLIAMFKHINRRKTLHHIVVLCLIAGTIRKYFGRIKGGRPPLHALGSVLTASFTNSKPTELLLLCAAGEV